LCLASDEYIFLHYQDFALSLPLPSIKFLPAPLRPPAPQLDISLSPYFPSCHPPTPLVRFLPPKLFWSPDCKHWSTSFE